MSWSSLWSELRTWPRNRWLVGLFAAAASSLVMGIPTGVVPTPLYRRMTAVTWWDYPILAGSALLIGLVAATYVRAGRAQPRARGTSQTFLGGVLSAFAIGCPICNKLVVALIGASGALAYWAPLQPLLGVASVVLIAATLFVRLRGLVACAPVRRYSRAGQASRPSS